jgi:hypothetical protein
MQLFQVLNEYFPEIRVLSDDDTKLLFAILDKDGSSTISEEEFMDFGSVMMIEFVKSSVYATFVEMHFPEFYESPLWQRFCRIVKSDYFEYTIDIVLVLNAAVVSVQSYPELSGDEVHLDPKYWDGNIDTIWVSDVSMFCANHFFTHEYHLPIYVGTHGDRLYNHLHTRSTLENSCFRVERILGTSSKQVRLLHHILGSFEFCYCLLSKPVQ